jgi:hypothetical protein
VPSALICPMIAKISSTIFGASPSDGSSRSNIEGRLINARDGEHLLFTPRQGARQLRRPLAKNGKDIQEPLAIALDLD